MFGNENIENSTNCTAVRALESWGIDSYSLIWGLEEEYYNYSQFLY